MLSSETVGKTYGYLSIHPSGSLSCSIFNFSSKINFIFNIYIWVKPDSRIVTVIGVTWKNIISDRTLEATPVILLESKTIQYIQVSFPTEQNYHMRQNISAVYHSWRWVGYRSTIILIEVWVKWWWKFIHIFIVWKRYGSVTHIG